MAPFTQALLDSLPIIADWRDETESGDKGLSGHAKGN